MVDLTGGSRHSIAELNFKGAIRFEGIGGIFDTSSGLLEPLCKGGVFNIAMMVNFDSMGILDHA